ncbi:MAG TPA: MBL fold metallo-hydrolase [Ideonella sp.]|uniref:MBL fold metallo-hydrolase n=1 Tax=Ideonella sp. TaxID=1929293 RepID=UPI002E36958A|nr:MBL fold metallo-hydrolase [Ideonella sp.]HEX5683845.1 MBL fold metallo-hydrolase [Ideonella sp.]
MIRQTFIAATLALAFNADAAGTNPPLQIQVYNAGANSFHANAVVVSGATEALVIDTGFTRADAYRIAANVLDTGKSLKTILVSNADPDYYFGAETLKAVFPQAQIVATPAVRDKIQAKMSAKLAFWGPKMGVNAPTNPVLPQALAVNTLTVDGQAVEVRGSTGMLAHRPYVWIPSIGAVLGNIAVFGNLHVWTADTQRPEERQAWLAQLEELLALKPGVVVPGHMATNTPLDSNSIRYTRDYLLRFDAEADKAGDASALIAAMKKAYPDAGLGVALDIGAKVRKGEMAW